MNQTRLPINIFYTGILCIALVGPSSVLAQQDPIYAQYLNNPMAINPAFTGINSMLNVNLQYRMQWAGLEANPNTVNFHSHIATIRNTVGLGVMFIEDRLGDVRNTELNTLYSYKLRLRDGISLSFGMQTRFTRYSTSTQGLTIRDASDPAFVYFSQTRFNVGAGAILKSDRLMVGLSAPRLIPTTIHTGGNSLEVAQPHYYLFGSYLVYMSERLRLKPSILLRATSQTPLSADINATLIYKESLGLGLFTRNFSSHGILVTALVDKFRFGYVFEFPGGTDSSLNFVSHELTVGLSMAVLESHDKYQRLY